MRKLLKVFVLVIVLVAMSAGGYIYYKSTVMYAVHSIFSAVNNSDWDKFTRFVDVDAVYESAVNRMFKDSDFAKSIAFGMKSSVISGLKASVESEKHSVDKSASVAGKYLSLSGLRKIKIKSAPNGKIVMVDIPVKTESLDIKVPTQITFKKSGGHQVLTDIEAKIDEADMEKIMEEVMSNWAEKFLK